ncbi:MAG TPA: hypothetical protein VFS94_00785 [Gemmatimonadales bacterium]|nr:hypothetical protein [Gemmatimonadales bacterium]
MSPRTPLWMLAAVLMSACSDASAPEVLAPSFKAAQPAPAGLATVSLPLGGEAEFWPYTGTDFSGTGQDPINVIIVGEADPLAIRAALMNLDGDRTGFGFPGSAPFDCRWEDGVGGSQTGFSSAGGWTGSVIQMQCGEYGPVRFHIRLFDAGDETLVGAHFEILIPGTADHQVLSWELAEQMMVADLMRTGLAGAAPSPTQAIHAAPFRDIPAVIYNLLPVELKAVTGGPLGEASDAVPIPTDGSATIVTLASAAPIVPGTWEYDTPVAFGQVVPKPFCSPGPAAYLQLSGTVQLHQRVTILSNGNMIGGFTANGQLGLLPLDFSTGSPVVSGERYGATVAEEQIVSIKEQGAMLKHTQLQAEEPMVGPFRGRFETRLAVGPEARNDYVATVTCGE